jgi:hypothetical protein
MGCELSLIPGPRGDPDQSLDREIFGRPFLYEEFPQLPADAVVFVVKLRALNDLPPSKNNTYYGTYPFVEFRLLTGYSKDQVQRSSHRQLTFSPIWVCSLKVRTKTICQSLNYEFSYHR